MKSLLSFFLVLFSCWHPGQIIFNPPVNFYSTATQVDVILSGSGTIFYTTDGSDPTLSSSSALNSVTIAVQQTTLFKARLDSSPTIFSRTYYFGSFPTFPVYFKPPAQFVYVCAYPAASDPETTVDYFWPGISMTAACDGWYKTQSVFVTGTFTFNDCHPYYPLSQHTPAIFMDGTVFYDYTSGPVTNPPACLLATNEVQGKVIPVKVFPNPVQDLLKIDSAIKFVRCEILDFSGKKIGKAAVINNELNVSQLTGGVYFLKLMDAENGFHYIKFIKSNP